MGACGPVMRRSSHTSARAITDRVAVVIASVAGAGYSPVVPGRRRRGNRPGRKPLSALNFSPVAAVLNGAAASTPRKRTTVRVTSFSSPALQMEPRRRRRGNRAGRLDTEP